VTACSVNHTGKGFGSTHKLFFLYEARGDVQLMTAW